MTFSGSSAGALLAAFSTCMRLRGAVISPDLHVHVTHVLTDVSMPLRLGKIQVLQSLTDALFGLISNCVNNCVNDCVYNCTLYHFSTSLMVITVSYLVFLFSVILFFLHFYLYSHFQLILFIIFFCFHDIFFSQFFHFHLFIIFIFSLFYFHLHGASV